MSKGTNEHLHLKASFEGVSQGEWMVSNKIINWHYTIRHVAAKVYQTQNRQHMFSNASLTTWVWPGQRKVCTKKCLSSHRKSSVFSNVCTAFLCASKNPPHIHPHFILLGSLKQPWSACRMWNTRQLCDC